MFKHVSCSCCSQHTSCPWAQVLFGQTSAFLWPCFRLSVDGLPVCICGPKLDSNALRQSYRHELVLLSKWDRRLVFRDECIAAAALWRNIAENTPFAFVAGTAVRALPKLQCAACCAALFVARLVYRRSWLLVYCSLPFLSRWTNQFACQTFSHRALPAWQPSCMDSGTHAYISYISAGWDMLTLVGYFVMGFINIIIIIIIIIIVIIIIVVHVWCYVVTEARCFSSSVFLQCQQR